jgi:HAD superfamily hydrolase (TIGR01509 family)
MTFFPTCRAAVFDFDGLMFNTEHLYRVVGGQVLQRRGKVFEEALFRKMMGRPAAVALQIMIDWHELHPTTVDDLLRENDELFGPVLDAHLAPMPGLVELLDALEKGKVRKAIATSSRRAFVSDILGRYGWQGRFEFWLTAEDVRNGKPNPEIYQTACARLELPPAQVLVLEDSPAGCQAGIDAGTRAVAVPGDYSRDFPFTGAALVADSLGDLRIYQALGIERFHQAR